MANVQYNSSFYRKIEAVITPTARRALANLSKKEAHWGIREKGDLAKIMGVLEFGDPAHTFPNSKRGSAARKMIEQSLAAGGENSSAIPPRPWLRNTITGNYRKELTKYINENLPKVIRGVPKRGQNIENAGAVLTADKFIQGLANVGKYNAINSWVRANFAPNAEATLANKHDDRPLHGDGEGEYSMSEDAITAWS